MNTNELTEAERNSLDAALEDSGCYGFQGDHPPLYAAVERILAARTASSLAGRLAAIRAETTQ